ncbi:helix-turn-helix domain-containing protein [Enterococcus rotai]|uniref:helix-turn-helix domain-containing protein n=1 Tax=Enterococcus rotai TaxID=118060 RepID=UPI0032B45520
MNLNDFLDEDYRYKWYILQILEIKKIDFYSLGKLMEVTGLSKYRVEKYLEEIVLDSFEIGETVAIQLDLNGEIHSTGLDNLFLKKMRLHYLEESNKFKIFKELLLGKENSVEKISQKVYISKTKIYEELKELKEILNQESIEIRNLKLRGEELTIRTFVFSIFYDFYNGIRLPFTPEMTKEVNEFSQKFILEKNVYLQKTQEFKLELYVGISMFRTARNNFIKESPVLLSEDTFPFYYRKLTKNVKELKTEVAMLNFFCYIEQIVSDDEIRIVSSRKEKLVEEITSRFLVNIKNIELKSSLNFEKIQSELTRINRRWLYFHFEETTFIHENKESYFQEIYPVVDKLIRTFLNTNECEENFKSIEEKTKIYYDYFFLLITEIPLKYLEAPLYICIDFSPGKQYNAFIQSSIESFRSMNVVFENRISKSTQLYISDFVVDKLVCPQIIWKSPPSSNDWKEFGDLIVSIKAN